MPELPEVETVCIALSKVVISSFIIETNLIRNDLRWRVKDSIKKTLENDTLKRPLRRGKYILVPTAKDNVLLIHLGMSGHIKIQELIDETQDNLVKHDHFKLIIRSKNKKKYSIIYNDPRRFGYIDLFKSKDLEKHFLLKKLGVEPLEKNLTVDYLYNVFRKKLRNIKSVLLDQSIIAGIGNIYASEILFDSKIHPLRDVNSLTEQNLKSLIVSIRKVLKKSIKLGGTTIKNHLQPDGEIGYFKQSLKVYGKKNKKCPNCKQQIIFSFVNKRSTYFCNLCQI